MKQKHFYLIMAIIGFVGPYYFFILFLMAHGLDGKALLQEIFATRMSTFFTVDLIVSSVVFVRYLYQEATRHSIGRWWLYVVALLTVGLSFALPLFLYARESSREARSRHANATQ